MVPHDERTQGSHRKGQEVARVDHDFFHPGAFQIGNLVASNGLRRFAFGSRRVSRPVVLAKVSTRRRGRQLRGSIRGRRRHKGRDGRTRQGDDGEKELHDDGANLGPKNNGNRDPSYS